MFYEPIETQNMHFSEHNILKPAERVTENQVKFALFQESREADLSKLVTRHFKLTHATWSSKCSTGMSYSICLLELTETHYKKALEIH